MNSVLRPAAEWELSRIVRDAAETGRPIEIAGSGTKRAVGRPTQTHVTVTTRGLTGATLYEPAELVMGARAGTLVADIEAHLAHNRQMMAFEPLDLGALLTGEPGQGTIGGVFAANLSGSRRVATGSARDQLLGVKAISGHGAPFQAGGRVMKNVTGYDLARGLTGSWGTLAVLTEVIFKVQPMPEATATLALFGLPDEIGVEVLCAAMGSPYEITGAIHLQQPAASRLSHAAIRSFGLSVTALRLENFQKAIAQRIDKIRALLKAYGDLHVFDTEISLPFWSEMRQMTVFYGSSSPLWRISTAPKHGPKVVARIARYMPVEAVYDWSGGLVWLEVPPSADAGATDIRRVIALHGGHATLVRAEPAVRAAVEVFQPLDPGMDRLTRRLKSNFDPHGVLNPGRMYAGV
jgi:glycolate oxidase FAD binding subunit